MATCYSLARLKCTACSHPLSDDDRVCPQCGTPVGRDLGAPLVAHPDNPSPGPATSLSVRNLPRHSDREEKAVQPVHVNDVLSGRYRLEAKIGEGGMGTVYTAEDAELDRKVAVKLLASNLVNDAEVVERFEREAKLTAKLDHPNIVPIYDVGRHEGRPFIVMKLLQGDTLSGVLRAKGGLNSDETLRLMRQIASGLDYIHEKGFIHRDIKAGNIFIAADGLATILDFGILRSKDSSKGLTRTGMVMGTPHYMAPEQALGVKDVDHRVDLYALAVVLFECLTGTLPFEADSELRLIQMQAHAPPPEILDRAPWVSKPVADVVRRALAKRPEERFSSAAELVAALEAAYRGSKGHPAAPVRDSASASWRIAETKKNGPVFAGGEGEPPRSTDELLGALRPRRFRPVALIGGLLVLLLGALAAWQPWAVVEEVATVDAGELVALAVPHDAGDSRLENEALDAGLESPLLVGLDESDDAGFSSEGDAGSRHFLATSPAKRKGRLRVLSARLGEPYWATVFIDGVVKGRTPLGLDLTAGRYQVRVERAGFKTQEREVRVTPGRSTSLRIDLEP